MEPVDSTPQNDEYHTGHDIVDKILPEKPKPKPKPAATRPSPPTKFQKDLWEQQAALDNLNPDGTNRPPRPRESMAPAMRAYTTKLKNEADDDKSDKKEVKSEKEKLIAIEAEMARLGKENLATLPAFLRPFLCGSKVRAIGRPASIYTFHVRRVANGKNVSFREFHVIVCWYQFLVGVLGGTVVGLETGYFNPQRLPPPNVGVPVKFVQRLLQSSVRNASVSYRFCKRALISGFIFDVIDKNIEEYRGKKDWINMGVSGVLTGGIFGMRGGFRGAGNGAAVFGGFAAMAGIFYQHRRKKSKQD